MSQNNIITIGTALKWRGIYDKEKTYYQDNIVLEAGCIFRCKVLQSQNLPPVSVNDEDGHFVFINKDVWDVILDMSIYYNKIADIEHFAGETMNKSQQLQEALDNIALFAKIPIKLNNEEEMETLIENEIVEPNQMYYTTES